MNRIIREVESAYKKKIIPQFRVGDFVRVDVKIVEGESERIQPFVGTVIRYRGAGLSATFTVRKISFGVGVERTFPLHSPRVEQVQVLKSFRVRRAKLYYLRKLSGKTARLERKDGEVETSAGGDEGGTASLEAPASNDAAQGETIVK